MIPVTPEIPDGYVLRRMREDLHLSQSELALAIGFRGASGEKVVRQWETRADFHPTGAAWAAFRYLYILAKVYIGSSYTSDIEAALVSAIPDGVL